MTTQRLERARTAMRDAGVDALLVGPSADLRYLVGYHALPLERLTLLVVPAEGEPALVVPELEAARAEESGAHRLAPLRPWSETDDPIDLVRDLLRRRGAQDGRLALQDRLWTSFTLQLQSALPGAEWVAGSTVMRELRLRKSPDEIRALHEVGTAIDTVHAAVPSLLRPGRTEAEVGRDIAERILVDHDEVNFVIVASGPNGASPHHETGERVLQAGDAVVVDIGGTRNGYCSDVTRDYVLGEAPDGYAELHAVLEEAQEAAVRAVRPGVPAASIDEAARAVIREAGYGEYFIHRTGHGIGVEEHEEPWIVGGNHQTIEAGMAFSIEPGIYVPGRYGARIEDIVVVTEDGVERVNHQPRRFVVC
ncbi:M24 family metallopeptidase [Egicoccus halophilus]|uniref:Dipeptidase n=1 Tax=Egicoccus halophilus TaxID=1670830 RepID=A0A8J3ACW1_9ACTN|nr:Xaa-Pro peptidase family protein [Egicoccus halophilus]GGI04703.1 dipeptidase [Egicoccus halophilus]